MWLAGFVYGAKENKKLKVFIDDINLPEARPAGIQRCNEVRCCPLLVWWVCCDINVAML